jgi:SAM-dependent methyltransferase
MSTHSDRILDQFTRQALPFSEAPAIRDEAALQLLVESSGATAEDTVLDVACGPGLVVRAFAGAAAHATGIDVTPAMLARAREVNAGLSNVSLDSGDVNELPYADHSFSLVVSRFAFHHFQDPVTVLAEMKRVCRPGGRVVVCDLLGSEDPAKAAEFHRIEMVRDPSHAKAHRLPELHGFFEANGLRADVVATYKLGFELEGLLERSFPTSHSRDWLREQYLAGVDGDKPALNLARKGERILGAYDVAILRAPRS